MRRSLPTSGRRLHGAAPLALCLLGLYLSGMAWAAPVRVEFWHVFSDAPRAGWIQARANEFNRTHAGVQVVPVPHANYPETFQELATSARTGKAPALVQISEAGTQLAVDSMLFRPLPKSVQVKLSDVWPAVRRYYTVNGQEYSIPFNTSSPVLYANLKVLQRAGVPTVPDTLEGITAACAALRRARVPARCLTFPVDAWYFEQWAAEQGQVWVDGGNGRAARATRTYLDSEAVVRPLRWLQQLNAAGDYLNTGKHEDNSGVTKLFLKGNVAFLLTSSSRIGQVMEGSAAQGFQVRVGPMPIPAGSGRAGLVVGGSSLWIPREITPVQAQAAQAFALYLISPANLVSWHRLSGYDPLRQSSVKVLQASGWFREGAPHTVAFRQFRESNPSAATAGALFGSFYEVRAVLHASIDRVLAGADVPSTLQAARKRADEIIRAYNARF